MREEKQGATPFPGGGTSDSKTAHVKWCASQQKRVREHVYVRVCVHARAPTSTLCFQIAARVVFFPLPTFLSS